MPKKHVSIPNPDIDTVLDSFKKLVPQLSMLELVICHLKLEKNISLKDIGKLFGMSHENVRLKLKKIYKKIKDDIIKHENIS